MNRDTKFYAYVTRLNPRRPPVRGRLDVPIVLIQRCSGAAGTVGAAGRGRISLKDIEFVLGNRIDADATLCTDSHSILK